MTSTRWEDNLIEILSFQYLHMLFRSFESVHSIRGVADRCACIAVDLRAVAAATAIAEVKHFRHRDLLHEEHGGAALVRLPAGGSVSFPRSKVILTSGNDFSR